MSGFITTDIKIWNTSCGLRATIRKNNIIGILCGYVEVPRGHPSFDVLSKIDGYSLDVCVHGGVTHFEHIMGRDVLVYGFDCGHYGDRIPILGNMLPLNNGFEERDEHFVFVECELLSYQLVHLDFDIQL